MVEPLRHRQTKGAATDMFYLTPPRHISTLCHERRLYDGAQLYGKMKEGPLMEENFSVGWTR
jgi:hypothetical protein